MLHVTWELVKRLQLQVSFSALMVLQKIPLWMQNSLLKIHLEGQFFTSPLTIVIIGSKKPMQLTTKAYLSQKVDRKTIEDLPQKEQNIDFNKFLLQFKSWSLMGYPILDFQILNVESPLFFPSVKASSPALTVRNFPG